MMVKAEKKVPVDRESTMQEDAQALADKAGQEESLGQKPESPEAVISPNAIQPIKGVDPRSQIGMYTESFPREQEVPVKGTPDTYIKPEDRIADFVGMTPSRPLANRNIKLENKSPEDLRKLHDAAILAEDARKRELYVARQRAAMAPTNSAETDAEEEVSKLKAEWEKDVAWIKQIEAKLDGQVKDIWGTRFGREI